ncbi:RagB/SusD family nutrient uptake outer membrane protein [Parapedobacter sp. 2B3]|uniref:RagB/SusD family nutrient uptake outer membrane protein n=1 Tax=Parapedobacter sp. 2B3 TaxID=3342381 RepID=UPI0035B65330
MKYLKSIVPALFFLVILGSCKKDFLSQVPNDRITIDEVFQRRLESEQYLANVYAYIKDEHNQWSDNPWFGMSDEGDVSWARDYMFTYAINLGSWDPNVAYGQTWEHYYRGIRSATYFIENIGGNAEILALGQQGLDLIEQYKAEAQFLRAWFYFCLVRQYGPVIIINEIIPPDMPLSELQIPRNTYDDCIQHIVSELDAAARVLPVQHVSDRDAGRATRATCMAVKSRVLLYAASPMNNGNTDYASFVNPDGTPLYAQQYDAEKWKAAADAAKAVIDLNAFSLYKVYDNTGQLDPLLSYRDVFLEPWNNEMIFVRSDWVSLEWERFCTPRFGGGWSGMAATQQQVDAYFMANGKAIDDNGSGYTESGFTNTDGKYTNAGTFSMYANREPRFYASIVYNGSEWINTEEGVQIIGLHRNGNSGSQGSVDYSRTGYLVKKNIHPNANPRLNKGVRRPYPLIRLAEIYLNYAEALNEYSPGHADILNYINLVRERAGIPQYGTPGLPAPGGQDAVRTLIRKERRVELAFETHRFFDVRRWKIAQQTEGGDFYGMDVLKGESISDPEFYKRTVFEKRVSHPEYALWPILQAEIDRNNSIVQNHDW